MLKAEVLPFLYSYKKLFYNHRRSIIIYLILCSVFIPYSWQQDVYDWYYPLGKFCIEGKNVYSPINTYAIIVRGESGRWGYPPLFLPIFSAVYLISDFLDVPFHIILKIFIVAINLLAAKKIEEFANNPWAVELFLFNPLVFISSIIQGFLDVFVMYLVILALDKIKKAESAVYAALSSLCKQTVWPLMLFFFVVNRDKKYALTFAAVFIAGLSPFIFTCFSDVTYSIAFQHQIRLGIMPFSYLLSLLNFDITQYEEFKYIQYAAVSVQVLLVIFFAAFVARRVNKEMDKIEILKYFFMFEVVSLSFLYLLVPLHPHFLVYLIIPIVILACVYPKFRYLYIMVTLASYISFTVDSGLRHNVFHYPVWQDAIYLGYWRLTNIIWPTCALLSVLMYLLFFYALRSSRRKP